MLKPFKKPSIKIVSLEEKDVITTSEVEIDPDYDVNQVSKSNRHSVWDRE